ncbi:FAD-binding oxidoreductase [Nocardia bovistercoris]|uniref:FAD-binding oxidoreductase n=1 Tax=Nocardia bovistercoris TaxID=2785916 RepID=A0A931IA13_9NOCA|nr:FAD-binding protein [Nocardia bovistercoris]MBH0776432.1 FAD-binding oxidoreductase [Nocardia bovistercoris]
MTTSRALADLRAHCELHLPGDDGYDAARTPWNVAVDQRPAAVAVPRTAAEVAALVRAAVAEGLRVAPQNTGHGAGALGEHTFDDVVLLRLSEFTGVTVDPVARTATVAGGTRWHEVVTAAAAHGLTAAHGSAPDVAVAGYLLGGGLSFYGRRHGVAANAIRALEVVLGDGSLVRATAQEHPDLFWAIRGGGANLGIVVSFEIDLLPYSDIFAGMLLWDRARAADVVPAWVEWSRTAPESATTSLRIMSFPPLPELPPFLSGRDLVIIDGAILEDDATAAELLTPLRALAPELDTFARIPAPGLLAVHMDPPTPTPTVADHSVLGDLDAAAVAAFLAMVGDGTTSGLMFAELRHLGGAFTRPAESGGALSHIPGEYGLFCLAVAPTPQAAVAGKAAAFAVVRALSPWSRPNLIPTFTEHRVDTGRFYDGEDWAHLCRIRDHYAPTPTLVANHPL